MMNNFGVDIPSLISRNLKKLIGCEVCRKFNNSAKYYISEIAGIQISMNGDIELTGICLIKYINDGYVKVVLSEDKILITKLTMWIDENTLVSFIDYIKMLEETNDE